MAFKSFDEQLQNAIEAAQQKEDSDVKDILIQIQYVRSKASELKQHLDNDGWKQIHEAQGDGKDAGEMYGEVTQFFRILDNLHALLLTFMKDCEKEEKVLREDIDALKEHRKVSAATKAFYAVVSGKLHEDKILRDLTRWHVAEIEKCEASLEWKDEFVSLGDKTETDKAVLRLIKEIRKFQIKVLGVHDLNEGFQRDWEHVEEKLKNPHLLIAQNLRLMQNVDVPGMYHACGLAQHVKLQKENSWSLTVHFVFDKCTGTILKFDGSEPAVENEDEMVAKMELTTNGEQYLLRGMFCAGHQLQQIRQIERFAKNVLYKTVYFYNKLYGYRS